MGFPDGGAHRVKPDRLQRGRTPADCYQRRSRAVCFRTLSSLCRAGAPLGTRAAAKQSESKSKLMPNLFESRGLRRLWASHGLTGSHFKSESPCGKLRPLQSTCRCSRVTGHVSIPLPNRSSGSGVAFEPVESPFGLSARRACLRVTLPAFLSASIFLSMVSTAESTRVDRAALSSAIACCSSVQVMPKPWSRISRALRKHSLRCQFSALR